MKSNHDAIGEFRHALRNYRKAFRKYLHLSRTAPNSRIYLLAKYGLKGYAIQLAKKWDEIYDRRLDNKEDLPGCDVYAAHSGWWSLV